MPKIDVNMVVAAIFAVFALLFRQGPSRRALSVLCCRYGGYALLLFNLVAGIFFRLALMPDSINCRI